MVQRLTPTRSPRTRAYTSSGKLRTDKPSGPRHLFTYGTCNSRKSPGPSQNTTMSEDRSRISLRKGGKRKSRALLSSKKISAPISAPVRQDVGLPPGAPPVPPVPDPRRRPAPPGGGKVSPRSCAYPATTPRPANTLPDLRPSKTAVFDALQQWATRELKHPRAADAQCRCLRGAGAGASAGLWARRQLFRG